MTEPKDLDNRQGSADVSADDERKKFIAQNGDNPNAQERAQDVPEPQSNELKDLQNELSEAEHQAKGAQDDGEKDQRLDEAQKRSNELRDQQNDEVNRAREENKSAISNSKK